MRRQGGGVARQRHGRAQGGKIEEITIASPNYLARFGTPATLDALAGHQMVGFVFSRTSQPFPLEFNLDGEVIEVALPARVLVSGADTSAAAARLGLGLVQAPHQRSPRTWRPGSSWRWWPISIRPRPRSPYFVLFPSKRQLSLRVRVFTDWLIELLTLRLALNLK